MGFVIVLHDSEAESQCHHTPVEWHQFWLLAHRIRLAFDAIFRKSATLQDVNPDPEVGVGSGMDLPVAMADLTDAPPAPASPRTYKKVQLVWATLNHILCILYTEFVIWNTW